MLQWLMNSGGAGSLEVCNSKIILIFNFRISECFGVLYCLFAQQTTTFGHIELLSAAKNLQWMFLRGGGYYIFVIFNCFFLFLTQKCALYRMSNSPNLNCIFSGGGALAENKIPQCNFNWPKGRRLGHFSLPEQVF